METETVATDKRLRVIRKLARAVSRVSALPVDSTRVDWLVAFEDLPVIMELLTKENP